MYPASPHRQNPIQMWRLNDIIKVTLHGNIKWFQFWKNSTMYMIYMDVTTSHGLCKMTFFWDFGQICQIIFLDIRDNYLTYIWLDCSNLARELVSTNILLSQVAKDLRGHFKGRPTFEAYLAEKARSCSVPGGFHNTYLWTQNPCQRHFPS